MSNNKGWFSDGWLDSRGLFQGPDRTVRTGSGYFWGKSASTGSIRDGSGNYKGRVSSHGGYRH